LAFTVYNTLTGKKEPFHSLEQGVVRMYNCGPTVYNRAHIGNFRAYLFADTLRRWLECSGYTVRQVMNITDVGHLQDDADEGEDKIEAQAKREKRDPWEISRGYTELFMQDLKALGCEAALSYPKASEHVPEMLEMIDGLVARGFAYQVGQDVYFEVSKFPRYGRLSGNTVDKLDAGSRIEVREEKRHPADFALWKSDAAHIMKWKSRYGPDGFPGWHIECSAMARKHLGDRIDIHTGGEDNIFPHHECEIAQSECFTGKPFSTYWMHTKFLQVDGGKMSKRLGNVYSLDDIRAKGFERPASALLPVARALPPAAELHVGDPGRIEERARQPRRPRRRAAARAGRQGAAPSADDGLEEVADSIAEFKAGDGRRLEHAARDRGLMKLRTHAIEERWARWPRRRR
jgi:cysteinyl-tRNA synthetase